MQDKTESVPESVHVTPTEYARKYERNLLPFRVTPRTVEWGEAECARIRAARFPKRPPLPNGKPGPMIAQDAANPPGPRQVKAFMQAAGRLFCYAEQRAEITGVLGVSAEWSGFSSQALLSSSCNPAPLEAFADVADRFGWGVSRATVGAFTEALSEAAAEIASDRARSSLWIDKRITPEEHARREQQREEARKRDAQEAAEREASRANFAQHVPPGATFAVVAAWQVDDSDSMTDYFATHDERRTVIGWGFASRESFATMRSAALAARAELGIEGDPTEWDEHRESWSGGRGNVLGARRYGSGWTVRMYRLPCDYLGTVSVAECAKRAPKGASAPSAAPAAVGNGYTVETAENKRGPFVLVVMAERVERDEFERLRESAKRAGGWYSRAWGGQAGGFGFAQRADAERWARATFPEPAATAEGGAA